MTKYLKYGIIKYVGAIASTNNMQKGVVYKTMEGVKSREENTMKHEELRANECTPCPCMRTRKERFEYLVKEVSEVKQELRTANTEESVNTALDKLSTLMERLFKDSQVADVKGWVADISDTIRGVKLHDVTRSALDDMLEKLLERAREIIAEESKKENASKLKALFMELAEHSDEIAELIDINKIFG